MLRIRDRLLAKATVEAASTCSRRHLEPVLVSPTPQNLLHNLPFARAA
jgi:hypothetical protein